MFLAGRDRVRTFDYDAVYRGEPVAAGVASSYPVVPWDIGEPQPAVVELVRTTPFDDEILDAGCGAGDNTILLASHGYRVTGFDSSPTALANARERATAAGAQVEFVQANATDLAELADRRFATVLDCALYHCLDDHQRRRYVEALRRVTAPGARLHLLCWSAGTPGVAHPMSVSEENLRTIVGAVWDIVDITPISPCANRDLEIPGPVIDVSRRSVLPRYVAEPGVGGQGKSERSWLVADRFTAEDEYALIEDFRAGVRQRELADWHGTSVRIVRRPPQHSGVRAVAVGVVWW